MVAVPGSLSAVAPSLYVLEREPLLALSLSGPGRCLCLVSNQLQFCILSEASSIPPPSGTETQWRALTSFGRVNETVVVRNTLTVCEVFEEINSLSKLPDRARRDDNRDAKLENNGPLIATRNRQ